jgi:hypothetical protein
MTSLSTSPTPTPRRHPFTTAVSGRDGRPGSRPTPVTPSPAAPSGLTYVAAEARLAGRLLRKEVGADDAAVRAALGLGAGRSTAHALSVVRGDIEAVEDTARGSFLARSRPEPGDRLHQPDSDRQDGAAPRSGASSSATSRRCR